MSGTYSSGTFTETYQFVGEFVDRVTAPADQASVSLDRLGDTATDMSTQVKVATDAVAAGLERVGNAASTASARGFNSLQRSIDPLGASLRRAEADLTKLNTRIAAGGSELDKYNALLPIATAKVEALRKQHEQYNSTADDVTKQNKALGFAMRDLGTQSIDLFTQLGTGQNVFRALIQQGSQVVQVNKQMGVGFGEMAAAVGSRLLNPLTLAITAVAALGAAFVAAGVHTESLDRQLNSVGNALRGSRADFQGLSEDVVAAGRAVSRAMDTARADSTAAVQAIAAAPGWGGTREQLEHLGVVATQMSQVLGGTAVDNAKLLAKALLEPGDVAKDLADKHLTGLTASLENQIQTMQKSGRTAEGYAALLKTVEDAVRGVEQNTTDIQAAIKQLDQAFQDATGSGSTFAEGIGQAFQSAAATAIQMVAETIKAIGDLVSYVQSIPSKLGGIGAQLGALVPQGISRGVRQFLSGSTEPPPLPSALEDYRSGTEQFGPPEVFGPSQPSAASIASGARYQQTLRQAYSTQGPKKDIADITAELNKMREAKKLATDQTEVKAFDNAIFDLNKKLHDAEKATEGQKSATEELSASLARATTKTNLQADQLIAVTKAADQGGAAVNQLNASFKAQEEILSKDTKKLSAEQIAAAIDKQTEANLRLIDSQNQAAVQKQAQSNENQIAIIEAETAAIGKNAVERTTIIEQLKIEQDLKQSTISTETEYGQRLLQSAADMAKVREENKLAQASFSELSGFVDSAFNTISNAITQAFVQGQGAAVNFGNVVKAIVSSLIQEFLKLALINPLRNMLFGGNDVTLGSVAGLLGGGGIAGGGTGSSGFGGLLQLGGLASQGYGLFGGGGLGNIFSGTGFLGSGGAAANFLATPLIGSVSGAATNTALAGLGAGVYGPATAGAYTAAGGGIPLTIGGAATGVGLGFGLGSLAGGLLQSSLGKTGPGPMIGAGVGALGGLAGGALAGAAAGSVVPVIGTIIGAIAGGLLGGAIGPKPPSPYSATYVGLGGNGFLEAYPGLSGNQIAPSNYQMVANEVSTFNQNLGNLGVRVSGISSPPPAGAAGGLGFFGQAKNAAGLAGASVTDAFSRLRFGAQTTGYGAEETEVLNRALDRTFSSFAELAPVVEKVRTFMERTLPSMRQYGENIGSLQQAINQISAAFNPAIATAHDLGFAEQELTDRRDAQIAKVQEQANAAFAVTQQGYASRFSTAAAALSGNAAQVAAANLQAFDLQSNAERKQLTDNLTQTYGDAIKTSQFYADQIVGLDRALAAERLVIIKDANDAIIQQQQQAAEQQRLIAEAAAQAALQGDVLRGDLNVRLATAQANSPETALGATLAGFDQQANAQRKQLADQFSAQEYYADLSARLETTLGAERARIQQNYNDVIIQQQQQAALQQEQAMEQARGAAAGLVTSLSDYVRGLKSGGQSPVSPFQQLLDASRQFSAVAGAAMAGDSNSFAKLPSYTDAYLSAARSVYGSGSGFSTLFQQITDILATVAEVPPDTLTASIYAIETRTQTATLEAAIQNLQNEVAGLRAQIAASAAMPDRLAA